MNAAVLRHQEALTARAQLAHGRLKSLRAPRPGLDREGGTGK